MSSSAKLEASFQALDTKDVVSFQALLTVLTAECHTLQIQQWPVGSVPVIGSSAAYANGLAFALLPTGLTVTVSLLVNWPTAGLYQREAMFTCPVPESVYSDW